MGFGSHINDEKYKIYEYYKEIRTEVTHPERRDQLIYDYLTMLDPSEFVDCVQYIFVKSCEIQNKCFQYWMLGWNYVGYNFNVNEPYLSNNLNGFFWSINRLGVFRVPMFEQMSFENRYMTGFESYKRLQKALARTLMTSRLLTPISRLAQG